MMDEQETIGLKQAVMLQINERLFEKKLITRSIYEQMKVAVVNKTEEF